VIAESVVRMQFAYLAIARFSQLLQINQQFSDNPVFAQHLRLSHIVFQEMVMANLNRIDETSGYLNVEHTTGDSSAVSAGYSEATTMEIESTQLSAYEQQGRPNLEL
jgi:hypothetical protein